MKQLAVTKMLTYIQKMRTERDFVLQILQNTKLAAY